MAIGDLSSGIYAGRVRHRRFEPVANAFDYRLYMMYLDLDELPTLFDRYLLWSVESPNLASFRRRDHVGHADAPLSGIVRDMVEKETGSRPSGPIRLLTHLRYFGYIFNPVSFYYCYGGDGQTLETIVAEVHNTPWNEQHCYVLSQRDNIGGERRRRFRFSKDFHVSPFMPMEMDYDWRFGVPGGSLFVHMENWRNGRRSFDATMNLQRHEMNSPALSRVLLQYPFMTGKVISAIYWQALRLWWKKSPFYPHPRTAVAR